MTLLATIFGAIGIVLASIAWRHFARRRAFVRGSVVTTGRVVGLREERDGTEVQRFRYPKVRFRTASGQDVTFESGMAHSGAVRRVGELVSVRYEHDRPESAEIASFGVLWGPCLLFGVLAAVFLILGTVLWLGLIPA